MDHTTLAAPKHIRENWLNLGSWCEVCQETDSQMPYKLKVIIAYGVGHMKGCNGNSILGTCKTYYAMFRSKSTGREKEIYEGDQGGKNVEK